MSYQNFKLRSDRKSVISGGGQHTLNAEEYNLTSFPPKISHKLRSGGDSGAVSILHKQNSSSYLTEKETMELLLYSFPFLKLKPRKHDEDLHGKNCSNCSEFLPICKSIKRDVLVREECSELRQEASDLQEYSTAKLDRVTRYLGALADQTRQLDQAALETEARISPLILEKKRLFNDLLTAQGNIKVFCRVRPLFEDEGPSIVEYPDDVTVRVSTADDSVANPKKDFELDRVYGPHVGQVELFSDVQPFVQSAFDGYNVAIFAYGQAHSGKTHTMVSHSSLMSVHLFCSFVYFERFIHFFSLCVLENCKF
ncbi:hypothetical protein T459_29324 [Capsicum annuum]|uniref:Kinesin motor domain-containing protein n=1 Tax=Capsicum annuum TaxID=4072 RepID=A0A2G2Y5D0_CAPAN|nr:hypothetical protein T459_29324 [Capsicum annuum]